MHYKGLTVKDNGIEYLRNTALRVFEKLFRVPTDNVHNIKRLWTGPRFHVNYIIKRHQGFP